jgi:hypothetical protein
MEPDPYYLMRRDSDFVVFATLTLILATLASNDESLEAETEIEDRVMEALAESRRRQEPRAKRMYIKWDWDRARQSVDQDYMRDVPRFQDRQFERVFRVTRSVADCLLAAAAQHDPFFTERTDATFRRVICPKVKLLMALKQLAYGVSPSAFRDYFQMGETTGRACFKNLQLQYHLLQTYGMFSNAICREQTLDELPTCIAVSMASMG